MSNEIAKEVLRNAILHAYKSLDINELMNFTSDLLFEIRDKERLVREIIEPFEKIIEKSFEQDAKELDDAQRYRDLKS